MQALPFTKTGLFLNEECEEREYQEALDALSSRQISWDTFRKQVPNPFSVSRISTKSYGRTLLHLAVLDNQPELVTLFKKDPILKIRRDIFGLSPIDLARFLNRTEILKDLESLRKESVQPALPSLEDFEYLSYPTFETKESLELVLRTVSKAKAEDKIPAEKIWMGIYFDKEIRMGVHAPISVRHIDDQIGYGVFAEKKIPPCSFVGEYTGLIQEKTPKQLKTKNYCLRYAVWEGKKNFAIDAEGRGNFTRFLNHSSTPNLGLQSVYWRGVPRMIFISLREISEGDQLTFDYGPIFWKNHPGSPKSL